MRKFFTHSDPVVPVHHPRVLLETAVAQGAAVDALLANVGIRRATLDDPDALLTYVQFALLTHNALELTGNPALGMDFGRNIHCAQMGVLGLVLMSSPTFRDAIDCGLRYYRALAPAWDLRLRVDGEQAIIECREAIPLSPFRVFATEALIAAMGSQSKALLGESLVGAELRLNYAKPAHFDRYLAEPVNRFVFDAEMTQVRFPAAVLATPIAGADPATARLAEEYLAARLRGGVAHGLIEQVRAVLAGPVGPRPSLAQVARLLQTSPRSLRRSLMEMKRSYQGLMDEACRARAEEWLRQGELTIAEMTERLGYSDERSFRRAFKRWTGRLPRELGKTRRGVS